MKGMELWLCGAGIVLLLLSAVWTLCERYRVRKIMEHMNQMIESAASGNFQEEVYDESMLSSVETKLAHYLSASKVSAWNITEEKEKVKKLIADISHQTKTPIANILLYAQLLEEKELPGDCRDCVSELNRQAEKLNFLIGSLVKTSRLETGIFVLHPKMAPVLPMMQEMIAEIAPKAKQAGLSMEFEPGEFYACFDQKWTAEAIYNIVDNAVKYTPSGGKITVRILDTELFVRIDITDTGIGIPEGETAKIFGRFYRSPAVSEQEGVGIGLYLSRQIVAEENGYIKVKSSVGRGSTFSVYLPAALPGG